MTIIIIHVVCINNINLLFSASGELSIDMNQMIREHYDAVSVVKTPSSGWVVSITVTLLFTDHSYR